MGRLKPEIIPLRIPDPLDVPGSTYVMMSEYGDVRFARKTLCLVMGKKEAMGDKQIIFQHEYWEPIAWRAADKNDWRVIKEGEARWQE